VGGGQLCALGLQHGTELRLGFGIALAPQRQHAQVVPHAGHVEVIGAEPAQADLQGLVEVRAAPRRSG
jgi:hypothetical protein